MYNKIIYIDNKPNTRTYINVNLGYLSLIDKDNKDELLTYMLKLISDTILLTQKNGFQTICINVYTNNVSMKYLDPIFIRNFVTNVQLLFPDRLHECFVYNLSKNLRFIFENVVFKLIDSKTKNKIIFI